MDKEKSLSALANTWANTWADTLTYKLARHIPLAGRVGLVSLGLALAPVAMNPSPMNAWASDGLLHNIRYDQGSRHFVIDTSGPVKAIVNTLTIAGRKRIIIDLDNADIGGDLPRDAQLLEDLTNQLPTLKNITVNQYGGSGKPIVRVLLDLQGEPGAIRLLRNQGPHIELELSDYAANSNSSSGYNAPALQPLQPQTQSGNGYGNNGGYTAPTGERPLSSRVSTTQTAPDTVSREQFNQSIRTQQALQQQIDSLRRQLSSQGSGPQLDEMKRTLVVMNQRYEQLSQENQSLKNKLSGAQTTATNTAEVSRLQQQLASAQADLRATKSQLNQLQADDNQLQAARQDLATLKSELDRLKTQANNNRTTPSQQESINRLSQDNQSLNRQLQQLSLDKATLNNQVSQLKTQLASKPTVVAPSQSGLSDSEAQELRRQLSSAQQAMNDSLKTIQEQNQEMAYLRNQVNTVKSGMDSAAKEQITSLQNANEQKDRTISDLRQQLDREKSSYASNPLNTQLATTKSQLESNKRTHEIEVQDLQKQLQDKSGEVASLRQQLNDVVDRQNNHPTTLSLRQKEARISELEKALFQANQQVQAGQGLQRQLDESKAQIAQLKANEAQRQATQVELGDTKAQLARLQTVQKQLEAAQVDLRITKAQLAQMQADDTQLKAARQDLIALKAELDRVKAQANSPKTTTTTTPAQTQAQQAALTKLTQDNQSLSRQLEQVNDQLKTAQQQLAASKPPANYDEAIAQYQRQVGDLNQQLLQANAKLKAAQATTTANSGHGKTSQPTIDQMAQWQKHTNELNQQLSQVRRENEELRSSLASKSSGRVSSSNADAESAYQEAKTSYKAKKLPDAIDKYKAALLLDPDNSRYAVDYSVALSEDQQYAEAIDVLRRFLQRNPTDREAYNQLGKIYLLNDQPDAANQAFVRAIPVSTINNYATSLKKLGKLDDAERMFKVALSINPRDSEVLFNLGNLYNNQNKLDLARNKYLEAIQIRPDFAEAHYNLGLIFSKLGNNPKAVEHLEKFLQLSPNARNAETIRAYVQKLKA